MLSSPAEAPADGRRRRSRTLVRSLLHRRSSAARRAVQPRRRRTTHWCPPTRRRCQRWSGKAGARWRRTWAWWAPSMRPRFGELPPPARFRLAAAAPPLSLSHRWIPPLSPHCTPSLHAYLAPFTCCSVRQAVKIVLAADAANLAGDRVKFGAVEDRLLDLLSGGASLTQVPDTVRRQKGLELRRRACDSTSCTLAPLVLRYLLSVHFLLQAASRPAGPLSPHATPCPPACSAASRGGAAGAAPWPHRAARPPAPRDAPHRGALPCGAGKRCRGWGVVSAPAQGVCSRWWWRTGW